MFRFWIAKPNYLFKEHQVGLQMIIPFYITTSNIWGLQILHILVNICYYLIFWL